MAHRRNQHSCEEEQARHTLSLSSCTRSSDNMQPMSGESPPHNPPPLNPALVGQELLQELRAISQQQHLTTSKLDNITDKLELLDQQIGALESIVANTGDGDGNCVGQPKRAKGRGRKKGVDKDPSTWLICIGNKPKEKRSEAETAFVMRLSVSRQTESPSVSTHARLGSCWRGDAPHDGHPEQDRSSPQSSW